MMARALEDIPVPDRDITLDQLEELNANGGTLRIESKYWKLPIQREWPVRTVMVHKGCVYIFKSEKQKSDSQFTLYGYKHVEKLEAVKKNTSYSYAFVIRNHLKDANLDLVFAAPTEKEREKWIGFFQTDIQLANMKQQKTTCAQSKSTSEVSSDIVPPKADTLKKFRSLPPVPRKTVDDRPSSYIPMLEDTPFATQSSQGNRSEKNKSGEDVYVEDAPCGEQYICEYDLKEDCPFIRAYSENSGLDIFAEYLDLRDDGTFYVRDSQTSSGEMTLIVYAKSKGRKFKMVERDGEFHLKQDPGQSFDSPNTLVEHYLSHPVPSQELGHICLTTPYKDHPCYKSPLVPLY